MSPQDPNILPMNIGLAPEGREIHVAGETGRLSVEAERARVAARNAADENGPERVVKAGTPTGKTFDDEVEVGMDGPPRSTRGPSMLVGSNGMPIFATPDVTSDLIDVRGETLNSLTWPTYMSWRKTKTRPYDFVNGPSLATNPPDGLPFGASTSTLDKRDRALEEIDQATHEFIGEVAELGELFIEHGPTVFWGNLRDKLIDECGDILFCATWAFDAWGSNPLNEADDLELMRVTDDNELTAFAQVIASNQMGIVMGNAKFVSMLGGMVFHLMLTAQTNAGLTANSFKKLRYQRREQDVDKQIGRIANTLIAVNQLLIVANSSVEEALKINMRKLDARRPGGYNPAVPGGIRTGEGA
jgi:hypothetical protein